MYIDGRPNASRIIAGLINNTRPKTKRKQPNCIFEGHEGNQIFVCAMKTTATWEELLVDYNLNRIDKCIAIMGLIMFYQYTQPLINVFFLYF
jgi:hypothetical protein